MSSKLNKFAYEQLINEDIEWINTMPRTLEREHIIDVLKYSVKLFYPEKNTDSNK